MIPSILNGWELFLDNIFRELAERGIRRSELQIDHVCYRVETQARYDDLKLELLEYCDLAHESSVGNRMIAILQFKKLLVYHEYNIHFLELPAPKKGSPYVEGLQHVDLTVSPSLEMFMGIHPLPEYNTDAIHKAGHAVLTLKLPSGEVDFSNSSIEREINRRQ